MFSRGSITVAAGDDRDRSMSRATSNCRGTSIGASTFHERWSSPRSSSHTSAASTPACWLRVLATASNRTSPAIH